MHVFYFNIPGKMFVNILLLNGFNNSIRIEAILDAWPINSIVVLCSFTSSDNAF